MTELGSGTVGQEALETIFRNIVGAEIDAEVVAKTGTYLILKTDGKIPGNGRSSFADYTTREYH